jgi:competence protein ComEC
VVALIAAYETLGPHFAEWRRQAAWPRGAALYLLGVAITTVVASLATMPFAAYHFNQVAHYGLAANLLAVPLTALWIMPWGVVVYALLPFGLEALALVPMGWGIEGVIAIAQTVSAWPGAVSRLAAPAPLSLALVSGGGLWLCLWWGRWRLWGLAAIAAGLLLALTVRPPDILIDGQGKVAAVRAADGTLHLSSRSGKGFRTETWLRRLGAAEAVMDGATTCDSLGCAWRVRGASVSFLRDGRAIAEECRRADIVLARVPIRRRCPSARLVVDRFDLWREGAHAIWLDDGTIRVETVAEWRGERAWSRGRGEARWRRTQ